jgi:hypothetical protein
VKGTGYTCFKLLIAAGTTNRPDSKLQRILIGYHPDERQEWSYRSGGELDKYYQHRLAVLWVLQPYSLAAGYHSPNYIALRLIRMQCLGSRTWNPKIFFLKLHFFSYNINGCWECDLDVNSYRVSEIKFTVKRVTIYAAAIELSVLNTWSVREYMNCNK